MEEARHHDDQPRVPGVWFQDLLTRSTECPSPAAGAAEWGACDNDHHGGDVGPAIPQGCSVRFERSLPMSLILELPPEVEQGLQAKAAARGMALAAFARDVLTREAAAPAAEFEQQVPSRPTGQSLVDVCAKVRGLLTDEEVDTLFARSPSVSRAIDFE